MQTPPPAASEAAVPPTDDLTWTRAMLLRELRAPMTTYRWEWVGNFLWPMSAILGVISYRGFMAHGWPALNFGCALLSFNFAVSAIVNQCLATVRRRVLVLSEIVENHMAD